jgi:hypothetical protein
MIASMERRRNPFQPWRWLWVPLLAVWLTFLGLAAADFARDWMVLGMKGVFLAYICLTAFNGRAGSRRQYFTYYGSLVALLAVAFAFFYLVWR